MSSVDDRIVNMKFNNQQFTQGADQSSKSLQALEAQLTKTGGSQGLNQLGSGVDGIKSKFSSLQVVGVAALATIASKATEVGLDLVKKFTIDPIAEGFNSYETRINAVKTILSNTSQAGTNLGQVTSVLKDMQHYANLTVYNFADMAKNVGTFTAAGVALQPAANAIKGIANLAALSGATSDQASGAMYQLSQALAAGTVHLQDWNSVVNAGIGGTVFQRTLVDTAEAMGTLNKNAVSLVGPMKNVQINGEAFRQSLSTPPGGGQSWLTSDVLSKALGTLTGDFTAADLEAQGFSKSTAEALAAQGTAASTAATKVRTVTQLMQALKEEAATAWGNLFEGVVGNFNQAPKILSPLHNFLENLVKTPARDLHQFINMFDRLKGRNVVIRLIEHAFKDLSHIILPLKNAISDIFPRKGGPETFVAMAKAANHFFKFFVANNKTMSDMQRIFDGIFAVLHIGLSIIGAVGSGFAAFFKTVFAGSGKAGGGILGMIAPLGDALVKLDKFITGGGKMTDVMVQLGTAAGNFIHPFVAGIAIAVSALGQLASGGGAVEFVNTLINRFSNLGGTFNDLTGLLVRNRAAIINFFTSLDPGKALEQLRAGFAKAGDAIKSFLGGGLSFSGTASIVGGLISGLVKGIANAAPQVFAAMVQLGAGIITAIKAVLGIHSPSTEMVPIGINVIQGFVQGLVKGVSLVFKAIAGLGHLVIEAFRAMFHGMNALDVASFMNALFTGAFLITITKFANDIAIPLKTILKSGFQETFESLKKTLTAFQRGVYAKGLLDIAIAVGVLTASLVVLSMLDPKKAAIGIGEMGAMMGELVGSFVALNKATTGGLTLSAMAAGMVLMATAMVILAGAVVLFGNMDLGTLAKGFGAIGLGLTIMVVAVNAMSAESKSFVSAGIAMTLMATALSILASAVAIFGNMDMGTLAKGFGSIALGLALMTVSLGLLALLPAKQVLAAGASIIIVADAMVILAGAVLAFGSMDLTTLAKGFGSVAVGLGLIVVAIGLLTLMGPETIVAAAGIALIAAAMVPLAVAIGMMGGMSNGALAKGLIGLAAALVILLLAAAGAEVVAVGLEVLGTAIALIGAGLFLAGAGMLAFATGFSILAVAGVAGVAVLVSAFQAFMALLPSIATQLAAAFISFLQVIANSAPRLRKIFDTIFQNILGVIQDNIKPIGNLFQALINEALKIIRQSVPQFINTGRIVLDAFLGAIAKEIPKIADKALDMIQAFLETINKHIGPIIDAGTDIIVNFLKGIGKAAGRIADATGQMILDVLTGIDNAVKKYAPQIRDKGLQIAWDLINGMTGGLAANFASAVTKGLAAAASHVHVPHIDVNPFNRASAKAGPKESVDAANTAVAAAAAAGGGAPVGQTTAAQKAQAKADAAAAKADLLAKEAAAAQKKANAKGAGKGAKTAANNAQKAADEASAKAQRLQDAADAAAQRAQDVADFQQADLHGKGDNLAGQAADEAEAAQKLFKKAQAEADQAREMQKKGEKGWQDLKKKAAKDAADAAAFAQKAATDAATASGFYTQEVQARIDKLNQDAADKAKADADQAAYDAADSAGKAKIMQQRAAADKAAADAAKANSAALVAQAQALAATDPAAAMKLLDAAEKAAQDAQDYADKAAQETQTAEQLLSQPGTSSGGGSGGGGIAPSRSVLEDAAKAIDRYTESLAQAEELAGATQSVVQYNQNVYSPSQLSAAEVYRQSKNLLSASEVKMGATLSTSQNQT